MSKHDQQDIELVDENLIKYWNSLKRHPKVIVFDLDYTLWPYFVDSFVQPPISKHQPKKNTQLVVDSYGSDLSGFPDVTRILHTLKHHCLEDEQHLAIASRSPAEEIARQVIDHLGWTSYFSSFQIYPSCKTNHMNQIKRDLGFKRFDEVLFFDDHPANITSTRGIGVMAIKVYEAKGLTMNDLFHGLKEYEIKCKPKK